MNVKQPQPDTPIRRVPARGRDGRDWGLGIADWGFEDWEAGFVVWAGRQTNPILAEEASALMMDEGLLMIWGKAMAGAVGGRSLPPMRQTNPICAVLGPKNAGARKNKPNLRFATL
jgi:hypothetical protein